MGLKIILTGATGMVGEGILQECIRNPNVDKIIVLNRKSSGYSHPKVEEITVNILNDIFYTKEKISNCDACFFCAGISSVGLNEEQYTKVTYDLTLNFAKSLAKINPKMTFCYVSGAGTDSTEKGRRMWARVKGKTENDLMKLSLKVFNFRPGFMKPSKGAKNVKGVFKVINIIYPLLRIFNPIYFLKIEEVGKAMINVTINSYSKQILEVKDISQLSKI